MHYDASAQEAEAGALLQFEANQAYIVSSSLERHTERKKGKEGGEGEEGGGRGKANLGAGKVSSVVKCLSRLGFSPYTG